MVLTASTYLKMKQGGKAPDFKLKGIDGKTYSLADFRGKKGLLVLFMCNHCPFVQPKAEKLAQLFDTYSGKGLGMIGINANDTAKYLEDSFPKMKEYAKKFGWKFPYALDESQDTAKAYDAACTPDPFLFDQDFKLVYHGRIDDAHGKPHEEAHTNELEEAIQTLLAGKPVKFRTDVPSQGCNVKWK